MNSILSHKQSLIDLLGDCSSALILDYGCGKGDFIELLLNADKKPKTIYAVDSDENMISHVKERFSTYIDSGIVVTKIVNNPIELHVNFDKVICHNVLECVDNKLDFINSFKPFILDDSVFIFSHYDFDSAIYNSNFKELSRQLVHYFSDTKQHWMKFSDGQIGRKIPGLINQSVFKEYAKHATWRLVDIAFESGWYGHLMANMLIETGKETFGARELHAWQDDLKQKNSLNDYYFAIDLVVAIISKPK